MLLILLCFISVTKQTSPEPQEESLSVNIPPEQPIGGNQQQIFFQDGQTEKEKEHLDPIAYAVSGSSMTWSCFLFFPNSLC